ncbi:hypothetical protein K7G91_000621 [Pasteurella canis]|uniref:hypothetical protein n=1 Tax=Pasteurella canis TaxID=753 RepID=UPI001D104330|nr:hypothetical protein [Pasteurella canis]UDW84351.1 hypothetical protein K7G91_000621 [Pasteurella canis]
MGMWRFLFKEVCIVAGFFLIPLFFVLFFVLNNLYWYHVIGGLCFLVFVAVIIFYIINKRVEREFEKMKQEEDKQNQVKYVIIK